MLSRITLFTAVLAICGGLFTVGGIVVPIKDAHAGAFGKKDKKCPKPARYRTKDGKCVASGVRNSAGINAYKESLRALISKAKYDKANAAGKKVKASGGDGFAMAKAVCAISSPRSKKSLDKVTNSSCVAAFQRGYLARNW